MPPACAAAGSAVWVSITGYGRDGPAAQRVAFGDDAAVAGGLIGGDRTDPVFCADAVADPLAGLDRGGGGAGVPRGRRQLARRRGDGPGRRLVRPPAAVARTVDRPGRPAHGRGGRPDRRAPLGRDTAVVLGRLAKMNSR